MGSRKLRALLLAPVVVLLTAAGPLLVDPPPIPVPAGLSEMTVTQSIRVGVAKRGWIVSRQQPGQLEATLNLRSHMAKIGIEHDLQSIRIRYLDSSNLDYEVKKDGAHIHRNYLNWINNVVQDITVQLNLAEAQTQD
jgi:hypothetical protein